MPSLTHSTFEVIGGSGFIISSWLFMLETQSKWYIPAPQQLGWHVGFWNLVGALGFTLCGALGFASSNTAYEVALTWATFIGSWSFLVRSSWILFSHTLFPFLPPCVSCTLCVSCTSCSLISSYIPSGNFPKSTCLRIRFQRLMLQGGMVQYLPRREMNRLRPLLVYFFFLGQTRLYVTPVITTRRR